MDKDTVIKKLAGTDPFYADECFFCDMDRFMARAEGHNDGCVWAEARTIVNDNQSS